MTLREEIIAGFDAIKNLPAFPETVSQVLNKINDPDSSAADIAKIIEYDQPTSAAILKVTNSVYYNPSGDLIGNVQQAIARLGLDEVRRICLAYGALKLFVKASDLINLKYFWKHCISTATLTKMLVELLGKGPEDQNNAFTACLFHDVGILILDQYFRSYYKKVRNLSHINKAPVHENERKILGLDHGELGAMLLRRWRFPTFICEAVTHHHEPYKCGKSYKTLCQIVHVADFFISSSGLSEPGEQIPGSCSQSAWFELGLEVEDMQVIVNKVMEITERASPYSFLD